MMVYNLPLDKLFTLKFLDTFNRLEMPFSSTENLHLANFNINNQKNKKQKKKMVRKSS